jgi:hypothetical protein
MVDLVALLSELADSDGTILIPGIYDSVRPLSSEEIKIVENIDFCQVIIEIKTG